MRLRRAARALTKLRQAPIERSMGARARLSTIDAAIIDPDVSWPRRTRIGAKPQHGHLQRQAQRARQASDDRGTVGKPPLNAHERPLRLFPAPQRRLGHAERAKRFGAIDVLTGRGLVAAQACRDLLALLAGEEIIGERGAEQNDGAADSDDPEDGVQEPHERQEDRRPRSIEKSKDTVAGHESATARIGGGRRRVANDSRRSPHRPSRSGSRQPRGVRRQA